MVTRAFATTIAASLAGLALAAFICWLWLATVDGVEIDW